MPVTVVPDRNQDGALTVDRKRGALLCGITPQAIANWEQRGYRALDGSWAELPVHHYTGRSPQYDVVELAKAKRATDERARRFPAAVLTAVA
jgi:hypothetical protein